MKSDQTLWASITGNRPAYVIAEGADAHYGDMARAREMICMAHESGADAIKFQHHLADLEMLPDVPRSSNMKVPLYEFLKRNALTIEQHKELADFASAQGITYLCTPFSSTAAVELQEQIGLPAYKIGSGELTDLPTLGVVADFGQPMIVSTGMAEVSEIDATYSFLMQRSVRLVLMNCTSAYPPDHRDIKLGFIPVMRERYPGAVIGHSDHSSGIATACGAIALGARVIEKHVTVDASLHGPDADVSITFHQLSELVESAGILHESSGATKELAESEREIQAWARRSLVYLRNLPAGHVISDGDIWGKRPGTGVPSARLPDFIGRHLTQSVNYNQMLTEADFT